MKYLQGTTNYGLIFKKNNHDDYPITLEAYCDADWAGDVADCKSTSGYLMKIGGTAISWKCSKQSCNALSSLEAEFIAAALASKEIIWLHRLLGEFGYTQERPTIMRIDNEGAKELANNQVVNPKTKHIDL